MEACLLVDVGCAVPQLLPARTSVFEVLEKGPFHSIGLPSGWILHWSSSSYQQSEVNSVATNLAKQLIKGDACLVHPNCEQHVLDELLHSRPWRTAQPCQPSTPRSSSSNSNSQAQQQFAWEAADRLNPSGSASSSSHAALKRAHSLQRIAAANSTRQRILSGMAAATAASSENCSPPMLSTPPQHNAWYNSSSWDSRQQHGLAHRQTSRAATGLPPAHMSSCSAAAGRASADRSSLFVPEQLPFTCLRAQQLQPQQRHIQHMHTRGEAIPFHLHNSSSIPSNNSSRRHATAAVTGVSLAGPPSAACSCGLCSHSYASCNSSSSSSSVPCGAAAAAACTCNGAAAPCPSSQVGCSQLQTQQCVGDDVEMAEAEEQQTAEAAAAAAPAWADLPEGVLGRVAGCLGAAVAAVLPMYTACRAWRRAVLDDDQLLLSLRFSLNAVRPLKPAPAQQYAWHAAARQQHPALLLRACQLGNVSALVARARLLDACGSAEEAMRCWKRAAKAGHLEGQLVYGLGLYRGIAGLQEEPQDAHMWLLRALKQVQKPEAAAAGAASSSAEAGVAAAASATQPAASAAAAAPVTLGMPGAASADASDTPSSSSSSSSDGSSVTSAVELSALSRRVLAQAGLVLGYLAFDGEGSLKVDKAEATRYFRLAAGAGCREAEEVLGWVYNTGQYGAI
uniref:Uncharacterized protein n=1 Tax=Tetradesmus obliquus TaxID=3088 RepID=A0A383W981_TETOB|eukprot:jgi/Sobl393_1/3212/SZX73732.1